MIIESLIEQINTNKKTICSKIYLSVSFEIRRMECMCKLNSLPWPCQSYT